MYYSLVLLNFTLTSVQFSLIPYYSELKKSDLNVLKNGLEFSSFSLTCAGYDSGIIYTLIPSTPFSKNDRLQIELTSSEYSSNIITVLFLVRVECALAEITLNLPQTPGNYYFSLNKINNFNFHISTPAIAVTENISPSKCKAEIYGDTSAIVFKSVPFSLEITLHSEDDTSIDDGFYDFDLNIEKK